MSTLVATKGLAIAASLFTGGLIESVSLFSVPALLVAPHNIAAKQFKLIYGIGISTQAPSSVVAAILHAFIAYRFHQAGSGTWSRWATSAALMGCIVPFTIAMMEPVNRQLLAIAGTGDAKEGGTEVSAKTEGLLRRWNVLNAVRGSLAVAAGAIGLWTVLENGI
ncbi:hypothetical protein QBC46DRAFT_381958 [Diplogelasinospora grovesii]|uniref:DUF1772-domain-containing protein n=1 Tax=Diplogelasinospora grovesii TaxID=303347 RepID=A0AAN6S636_9PEZI|nr:hypothetical protein QBC46DRAFT_381958 [Diplogelasinospora grovesii]